MDEEHRRARCDFGKREDSLERGELLAAEDAARHERRTGTALESHDRRRPAQLHERVVAGQQPDRERDARSVTNGAKWCGNRRSRPTAGK